MEKRENSYVKKICKDINLCQGIRRKGRNVTYLVIAVTNIPDKTQMKEGMVCLNL